MKLTLALTTLALASSLAAAASNLPLRMGEIRSMHAKARHTDTSALEKRYTVHKNGELTYYYGGQMANPACGGKTPNDNSMIVAVAENSPADCGDEVHLHYKGKMVSATVVDKCAGCSRLHFDGSKAVFRALAPLSVGDLHGVHVRVIKH